MPVETLIEGIVTLVAECVFAVVEYPGAALHWAIRKGKVPFDVLVKRWFGINLLLSLILYGLIIYLVIVLCY
jgi:quinol-cytochrome oxidoreductase complex cytochrome b subunit